MPARLLFFAVVDVYSSRGRLVVGFFKTKVCLSWPVGWLVCRMVVSLGVPGSLEIKFGSYFKFRLPSLCPNPAIHGPDTFKLSTLESHVLPVMSTFT